MTRDYEVIFATGLPGCNKNELFTQAASKHKGWQVLNSADLIRNGYQSLKRPEPRMPSILNWDPLTQDFALDAAFSRLNELVHPETQKLLIMGHATFPNAYDPTDIIPALPEGTLERLAPDRIIHVCYSPPQIQRAQKHDEWRGLTLEQWVTWANSEYNWTQQMHRNYDHNVPFNCIGGSLKDENVIAAHRLISDPETPIMYFSYPITGIQQSDLETITQIKDQFASNCTIVGHEGLDIEQDVSEWDGAQRFLEKFQLDMLMPQASINVAFYHDGAKGISAGTQAESNAAYQWGIPALLRHPNAGALSPYKLRHYGFVSEDTQLVIKEAQQILHRLIVRKTRA